MIYAGTLGGVDISQFGVFRQQIAQNKQVAESHNRSTARKTMPF